MQDQAPKLTGDQIQAVLTAADVRLRAFLGLIARLGWAPRQVLSLRREDVKLNEYPPRIHINQAYHASRGELPRTVEIDSDLADYLRDHLQSAHHLTATAPLFPSLDGSPLTSRWAQRVLARLCRRLGFGPIKLRDLRRAAIQRMADEGVPVPKMQEQLGLLDITSFLRSIYPSDHTRRPTTPARPKTGVGRPRKNMERDAELVRMWQQPDATYGTVTRDYNRLHHGEKELQRETVKRAIKRHPLYLSTEAKS